MKSLPALLKYALFVGGRMMKCNFVTLLMRGGANSVSLDQARKNFLVLGAIDKESLGSPRKPLPEDIPS
jgi:hypothetical protein